MRTRLLRAKFLLCLGVALVAASGVVAAGAVLRDDDKTRVEAEPDPSTTAPATTTTIPPTTTTAPPTIPELQQPEPAELPPVPPEGLGPGSSGPVVQAFEQRLADVKFDPGPIDGRWDQAMT